MDPLFFKCFVAALLTAQAASPAQPCVYGAVPVTHRRDWPVRRELPEDQEPDHGEGSSESLTYLGVAAYNTTSNTSPVSVYSPSGSYLSVAPATWLPKNFPLVLSTQDFPVEPFQFETPHSGLVHLRPDPKGHATNPAARRSTGSRS